MRPRLRLVHALSLMLLAAVLLAVLAMGGVMAWNLRHGFADYLGARDVERLEQFAALVGERAEQAGGADALRSGRLDMIELQREHAWREGMPVPGLPGGPPRPLDGGDGQAGERPGPPPGGPESFGQRVVIVGLDGQVLLGRPLRPGHETLVERPVRVGGVDVAFVRMRPARAVPDAVQARFLQSQYLGIASVAAALVLLALGGAWWVAGRWVRPLLAVQAASARIARGELDVRLPDDGRSDEIGDVVRNLNHMAEGLQRLEGARRRWIADISHELRTPLTVLRGEIEALADGVRPLGAEAVLSLREEVLRLGALVDDLHLLALSDLRSLPCHFAPVDVLALVRQAVQRHERRARSAGLTLVLELSDPDADADWAAHWDARSIDQLLGNLIDNSLRYTDAPGQVRLTLARLPGGRIALQIDDSAPGVPADDLPRVFEPLYRADAARSRHRGGSGLGLAICAALVQAHGGQVQAAASALGGLCVRIELPREPGEIA